MFGLLTICSSVVTVLFPIFASYKALRTSDPAQLTPWLMYWVVLSSALLVESWTVFILGWYALTPFRPGDNGGFADSILSLLGFHSTAGSAWCSYPISFCRKLKARK